MPTTAKPRPPLTEYRNFIWDTRRWERFEHRPGDIYVCTPPKCGTTWTQTIVSMLLFPDGKLPAPVMHLAPWVDARFHDIDQVAASLAAQQHRRSLKTHTPADGIPWHPDAFYIVVGRDGRDAFMSFVNHIANFRRDKMAELMESALVEGIPLDGPIPSEDIHEFFGQWLDEGSLFHFLMSYWKHRDEPNVLFVHYNDLKADLEGEVRRIAAFLGVAIDEAALPGILERCSFEWMRANSDQIGELEQLFVGGGQSFFFKGTNGRWRDVLTADELETYERRSREMLSPECKAWLDRSE